MFLSMNKPSSNSQKKLNSPKMKKIEESHVEKEIMNVWDCGSPLYDSYELVAVSHIVERHFMVLPYLSGSRKVVEDEEVSHSSSSLSHQPSSPPEEDRTATSNAGKSCGLGFLWKRKKMDGERRDKAKKQKTGIFKILPCRIK